LSGPGPSKQPKMQCEDAAECGSGYTTAAFDPRSSP
jgi:hypothetical protein